MGEVACVPLWSWVLGKQAFRQGTPTDQQGERPWPGGPWLGLRQGELGAESLNGGSVGTICPRVKIRGHGNPHQLASPRAPPPARTVHRPGTPATQHLCVWRSMPHQVLLPGRFSWPGGERAGLWEQAVKAKKGYEMWLSLSTRPGGCWGYRALSLGTVGAGNLFGSSASKGSRLGEAALARGRVSGCRTQPREQAAQDTALLEGRLHHEPVLALLPGGRPACV